MWLMIDPDKGITALVSDDFAYDYMQGQGLVRRVKNGYTEVWCLLSIFQPVTDWIQDPLF